MKTRTLAALLLSFAFLAPVQAQQGPTEPAYVYRAVVVRVVDGDTVDVDIDLGFYTWIKKQRIRLVGIDAPEMRGDEKIAGRAAKAYLVNLVEGKEIILRTIKGRDGGDSRGKYGRWLGRLYLNGVDVNQHMVEAGHAEAED